MSKENKTMTVADVMELVADLGPECEGAQALLDREMRAVSEYWNEDAENAQRGGMSVSTAPEQLEERVRAAQSRLALAKRHAFDKLWRKCEADAQQGWAAVHTALATVVEIARQEGEKYEVLRRAADAHRAEIPQPLIRLSEIEMLRSLHAEVGARVAAAKPRNVVERAVLNTMQMVERVLARV